MKPEKLDWKTCLKIGVTIFLLYLCITYWPAATNLAGLLLGAASPLLVGCALAYVVNILMSCYERHYFPKSQKKAVKKSRRPVCMILAFLTLVAVIILVVMLIVPQLASCFEVILAGVPGILKKVVEFIEEYELLPENIIETLENVDWRSKIGQIAQVLTSGIGNVVNVVITAVSSVFSWLVSALMSFIFSIYLLTGKEKLGQQFRKLTHHYLKDSWVQKMEYVLDVVNDCFHKYIVGQCTEAVIIGVLCTIGMAILRLPYATMIGALVAFTALIPVAGAWIGGIVGAFMILTVSPVKAVFFVVFLVVLQQLEGNIIYPRVVGSSMGLPGIWVLTAVTVGGGVLGIPGMLLGVPLVAAVYRLIREDVNRPKTGKTG